MATWPDKEPGRPTQEALLSPGMRPRALPDLADLAFPSSAQSCSDPKFINKEWIREAPAPTPRTPPKS